MSRSQFRSCKSLQSIGTKKVRSAPLLIEVSFLRVENDHVQSRKALQLVDFVLLNNRYHRHCSLDRTVLIMCAPTKYDGSIANQDLMADAGKVTIDPAEPWGRGLWIDAKRTIGTHWWKEVKNFNQKTIGVTLLMFISIIAPTLAFGAAYSKASGNYIGAIETILATAYMGMFMALFSGMPLVSIHFVVTWSV